MEINKLKTCHMIYHFICLLLICLWYYFEWLQIDKMISFWIDNTWEVNIHIGVFFLLIHRLKFILTKNKCDLFSSYYNGCCDFSYYFNNKFLFCPNKNNRYLTSVYMLIILKVLAKLNAAVNVLKLTFIRVRLTQKPTWMYRTEHCE